MSKNAKIIIGVLVLIILFLIFFFGKNDVENPVEIDDENTSSEIEVKPTVVTGKGSLDELLKRNENLECSISYKANATSSEVMEGSYFTSNGKMRGDFVTKDNGQEVLSSMVIKDNTFYSWSVIDGEKFGMKASMDQLQSAGIDNGQPKADNGPVSLDQSVNYDCKPWNNVDGSVFEPPNDIVFRDFGAIMNTGMEYGNIYEAEGVDIEAMMKEMKGE